MGEARLQKPASARQTPFCPRIGLRVAQSCPRPALRLLPSPTPISFLPLSSNVVLSTPLHRIPLMSPSKLVGVSRSSVRVDRSAITGRHMCVDAAVPPLGYHITGDCNLRPLFPTDPDCHCSKGLLKIRVEHWGPAERERMDEGYMQAPSHRVRARRVASSRIGTCSDVLFRVLGSREHVSVHGPR